jgi:2-oxoglutarate dehydrogenase E1 component
VKKYSNAKNYIWAQEEPENMGAWTFILTRLRHIPFEFVGRPESASPATGYYKIHNKQQQEILDKVFVKKMETAK